MWKKICSAGMIPFFSITLLGTGFLDLDPATAEAASSPSPQIAQREMKKSKDYQASPIYARAHQLIYGNDSSAALHDRVRIAVLINGDENLVVEDRVKNQIYSQLRKKFPREYFALMKGTDVNTKLLQYAEDVYYNERETATTYDTRYDVNSSRAGIDLGIGRDNSYSDASAGAGDGDTSVSGSGTGNGRVDSFGAGVHLGSRTDSIHREKTMKPSKVDVDGVPVGMQPRGLADMRREDYVRAGRDCGYDYVFVVSFSNGDSQIYNHNHLIFNTNTVKKNVWMRVRFVDVSTGEYLYRNNIVTMGKTHNGRVNGRVMERAVRKGMEEAMNDLDFVN